jgi:hypothetical protein
MGVYSLIDSIIYRLLVLHKGRRTRETSFAIADLAVDPPYGFASNLNAR